LEGKNQPEKENESEESMLDVREIKQENISTEGLVSSKVERTEAVYSIVEIKQENIAEESVDLESSFESFEYKLPVETESTEYTIKTENVCEENSIR
jgi:hypothetical protein